MWSVMLSRSAAHSMRHQRWRGRICAAPWAPGPLRRYAVQALLWRCRRGGKLGMPAPRAPRAADFPGRAIFPIAWGEGGSYVAPTQQRTCLWPSVVTQRRQAFWQSLWSLVRSTVSSTPPVASIQAGASVGRPGAMTPKIARFLAEQQPATPCLVLDVDRVEENFRALQRALPLARIYYAVKANPAPQVLERLVRLSSSFDAASFEEVAACLDAGARPEAISFGNTIKKASAIRAAYRARRVAVRLRFDRGAGEAGEARARRAGVLPHPGGERRRRLAAVAQVRHHDRERARR